MSEKNKSNKAFDVEVEVTLEDLKNNPNWLRNPADLRTLFIFALTWVVYLINWHFIYEIQNKSKVLFYKK